MRWTDEETRIVLGATNSLEAVRMLVEAGYVRRSRSAVIGKRSRAGAPSLREQEKPGLVSFGVPVMWPRFNQAQARRVAAFIEANSPMTLQQFEAGMREMEGRP